MLFKLLQIKYFASLIFAFIFSGASAFAGSVTYEYDELNRLKSARYDNGTEVLYSYDEIGNRTKEQTTSSAATTSIITVCSNGCGKVSPSNGDYYVNNGSSQTYSFVTNVLNSPVNIVVDGVSLGNIPTYTFNNVSGNHTLSVQFSSIAPDGDINLDGILNQDDVQYALEVAVGKYPITPLILAHGDVGPLVNGRPSPDGIIEGRDMLAISLAVSGQITFPTECFTAQPIQTATNLPVRIANNPASYFRTLQSAYNSATNGSTVQAINSGFTENANFNRNISVFLDGGYGTDYATNPDFTTINGTMTITNGSVTARNIIVR